MSLFWNRDYSIQVGVKVLAARMDNNPEKTKPMLRIVFRVDKSIARDPNKATVTVYNLGQDSRKMLQKTQPIVIEAGYTGTKQQIFSGEIGFVHHQFEDPDWVSYIETGDGADAMARARINKAFGPNTTIANFLKEVAGALGVGLGNSIQKINPLTRFRKGFKSFKNGAVASGKAANVLDTYLASAGLEWSIQDGQLQILESDEPSFEDVVMLSSMTGLLGSPEVGEKGKVIVRSLMQGRIAPGRRVIVASEEVQGTYKTMRVSHVGDTYSKDWYTEAEGKPI